MAWMQAFIYMALLLGPATARAASAEGGVLVRDAAVSTTTTSVTTLSTLTVTPPLATTTTTAALSNTSLIDGRCKWSDSWAKWCCRKGFVCEGVANIYHYSEKGGVCVDRRTPAQKEADKHEAADGEKGRCRYSYDTQSYYCTQRGFVCLDEMVCTDNRTEEEKAEDEAVEALDEASRQEMKRKHDRMKVIVGGTFGGLIGLAIGTGILCHVWASWRMKRRMGRPAREQRRRDRRQREGEVELRSMQHKENQRKAKLDEALEKALIKGLAGARPGSLEQRDLVGHLERARLARQAEAPVVGVGNDDSRQQELSELGSK